jgi:hypothetical protein
MSFVGWLDTFGKSGWIIFVIISLVLFWPAGLVVLGYVIRSGRMGRPRIVPNARHSPPPPAIIPPQPLAGSDKS